MTINEDPSPNLKGRQVDRSTSRQVDNSVLAVQINYIYSCTAAYPLETKRLITCRCCQTKLSRRILSGGGLAPQASYAIMLQV